MTPEATNQTFVHNGKITNLEWKKMSIIFAMILVAFILGVIVYNTYNFFSNAALSIVSAPLLFILYLLDKHRVKLNSDLASNQGKVNEIRESQKQYNIPDCSRS